MLHGKIQLWERPAFIEWFDANRLALLFDDEALGMDKGIDIVQCIKRPDGMHISADGGGVRCELHIDSRTPNAGRYEVSRGLFSGRGHVVEFREERTSSFHYYFYVKVVSTTGRHFVWRVAFNEFTAVTDET